MKTHVTTTKKFEKYLGQCKTRLELYKLINPPKEKPIPKYTQEEREEAIAFIETNEIKMKNKMRSSAYESAQREIEQGQKNLETLANSVTPNFPILNNFVFYDAIPTRNWGTVNLPNYVRYLKKGLEIINQELSD